MSEARWSRTAAGLGVVMFAGWIIAVGLSALDHQVSAGNITTGAGFLVFAGVGVLVAFHQPRNPVGWLLIFFTFFFILGIDARPCSTRYGSGCSGWWPGGSTGPVTTPTRPRPLSPGG